VFLLLPVTASAQQQRRGADSGRNDQTPSLAEQRRASQRLNDERKADARRSDERRSDDRQSDERRADQRRSERHDSDARRPDRRESDRRAHTSNDQKPATGLPAIGLPPATPTGATPWWERQQTPWWERQGSPSWEQSKVPAWQTNNPARALLNEERDRRRLEKNPRPRRNQPSVVYVLPPYRYFPNNTVYGYGVNSSTVFVEQPLQPVVTEAPPPEPPVTTGYLTLEVEPRDSVQVFVDGLYLGTLADLGEAIELRLGARRIELRAPGYRTLTFDTQIVPDRTIVYRGSLEPVANTPGASAPPPIIVKPSPEPGSRTIYVIPGCYLGNVAPVQATLRPGCDISKLSKIEP
jgi:hypothetical protein